MSKPKYFLDTSYVIALSATKDQYHHQAELISRKIESEQATLITTEAILLEIGNALAKRHYRPQAIMLIDALKFDPAVEIIPLTTSLFDKALQLFRQRTDKDWGLIDCISFVVMEQQHLTDALTTDEHFNQAGFNALLFNKNK
jgi:uncharacterized protein